MIKLITLSFAGGMQNVYYPYKEEVEIINKELIQFHPFEYPGRGARIFEQPYKNMSQAVTEISAHIGAIAEQDKFAIWGHSLGAVLAYEVYCNLAQEKIYPEFMMFSGANAPDAGFDAYINFDDVSAKEMMRQMAAVDGKTEEVNKYGTEIMEYFLPIIRSDLKLLDTYDYSKNNRKIDCPISVLYSREDQLISKSGIARWSEFAKNTEYYQFTGDHFFIKNKKNVPMISRIIVSNVERSLKQRVCLT